MELKLVILESDGKVKRNDALAVNAGQVACCRCSCCVETDLSTSTSSS